MKQRMAFEQLRPDGSTQRVLLEQSVQMFDISDVNTSVRCLLKTYGHNGHNVFDVVNRLLLEEALRQAGGSNSKAAAILGVSRRMMTYYTRHSATLRLTAGGSNE